MLIDVTNGGYTQKRVSIHRCYGVWDEYVPANEQEFRAVGCKVVRSFDIKKIGVRLASVNGALHFIGLPSESMMSFESSDAEWVEAYWILYRNHFLCVGYLSEDKSIKQFFARKLNADRDFRC